MYLEYNARISIITTLYIQFATLAYDVKQGGLNNLAFSDNFSILNIVFQ